MTPFYEIETWEESTRLLHCERSQSSLREDPTLILLGQLARKLVEPLCSDCHDTFVLGGHGAIDDRYECDCSKPGGINSDE